jgi:hypothetical protein
MMLDGQDFIIVLAEGYDSFRTNAMIICLESFFQRQADKMKCCLRARSWYMGFASDNLNLAQKYAILESLYVEARELGRVVTQASSTAASSPRTGAAARAQGGRSP